MSIGPCDITCIRCCTALPRSARFCRKCGQAVPRSAARTAHPAWWRFQSLGVLGFKIHSSLWWFVGVGGLLDALVENYDRLAGPNAARLAELFGYGVGGAICCFCGALVCSAFAWRLSRRSANATWLGGLVGVLLVLALPHAAAPKTSSAASGPRAIAHPDAFDSVPTPPPGFLPESQFSGNLFPPGEFAKLQGEARYTPASGFVCDLHNRSNWTLTQLSIRVKVMDADGSVAYTQTFTNAEGNLLLVPWSSGKTDGARERFLCRTTLANEVQPGQRWEWSILTARGYPAK